MKKIYSFHTLTFLLLLAGFSCLTSGCDNCKLDDVSATFTLNWYPGVFSPDEKTALLSNGEYLYVESWQIDRDNSSNVDCITSVDYYFDGEKILSTNKSPFSLKYLLQDRSIGSHSLTVKPTIRSDDGEKYTFSFNYTVELLEEPAYIKIPLCLGDDNLFEAKDSIVTVSKDEKFYGSVPSVDSNIGASITEVKYYWDDALFSASNSSPYKFNYDISAEETGEHTFKYTATVNTDYGAWNVSAKKKIIIKGN